MNRIYQGRVSKVEIQNPNKEATKNKYWIELSKEEGENALWQHHGLFQDAVNYYTLALVALGEGLPTEHPITKLRERMRMAWDEFPSKTASPALSLGQSLRKWLGVDTKMTFEDACSAVVSTAISPELARDVAILLAKDLSQTSDISEYGRSSAPRYFNPDYSGNFRNIRGLAQIFC